MNKKTIILTVMSTIIASGTLYADEGAQRVEVEKILTQKKIFSNQDLVSEILANLQKVKEEVSRENVAPKAQGCQGMWRCLETISRDLEKIEDDEIFAKKRQEVVSELLQANILDLKVENQELKVVLSDDLIQRLRDEGVIVGAVTQGGGTLCF